MKNNNDINTGYPIGNGEVVSSILTGSTRKAHELRVFCTSEIQRSATPGRTYPKPGNSNFGESVEKSAFVLGAK